MEWLKAMAFFFLVWRIIISVRIIVMFTKMVSNTWYCACRIMRSIKQVRNGRPAPQAPEVVKIRTSPQVVRISFPVLLAAIENSISPFAKDTLDLSYYGFQNKIITKKELIRRLRSVAGDRLLISAVRRLQSNVRNARRAPPAPEVVKVPTSPWMPIPMLLAAIQNSISPSAKDALDLHYDAFKNKIITREELIKRVRLIVGDKLLTSTLQRAHSNVRRLCH
ncbi:uncharacterized protein LOC143876780 [Tasmannia lanceolata]|uniref:uncharacterized protein LOC143876780 n=1 Tax=Tasmannia lanceolata TaxID=3420 RepID=UPI004064636F